MTSRIIHLDKTQIDRATSTLVARYILAQLNNEKIAEKPVKFWTMKRESKN